MGLEGFLPLIKATEGTPTNLKDMDTKVDGPSILYFLFQTNGFLKLWAECEALVQDKINQDTMDKTMPQHSSSWKHAQPGESLSASLKKHKGTTQTLTFNSINNNPNHHMQTKSPMVTSPYSQDAKTLTQKSTTEIRLFISEQGCLSLETPDQSPQSVCNQQFIGNPVETATEHTNKYVHCSTIDLRNSAILSR